MFNQLLSVDSGRVAVDPTVNPNTGEPLGNEIPIIKTRTLKTLAKIQSGNILVIGGSNERHHCRFRNWHSYSFQKSQFLATYLNIPLNQLKLLKL